MGNVPAAPYPANGKAGWVQYGGKKIVIYDANKGTWDKAAVNSIPLAAVDKMARWGIAAKAANPDKYSDFPAGTAKDWLADKGGERSKLDPKATVINAYIEVYSPPPSVGTLPGEGTVLNGAKSVTDLVSALFDPALWLRILEVGIGLVLVGVGLAKLTNAGPALQKIPLYGKMIP